MEHLCDKRKVLKMSVGLTPIKINSLYFYKDKNGIDL